MSEKTSPCLTGDHITSETILRAHFSAGGIVQVAGKEYWYRMPTTQLEMLCATSDEWVGSFRSLGELVRTEKVIACDEPELSREIRGDAERERQREEDNEQVRRNMPLCKCDGCRKMTEGYSLMNVSWSSAGMMICLAGHGAIAGHLLVRSQLLELRGEIEAWLERAP